MYRDETVRFIEPMQCYHLGTVNQTTTFKEDNEMKTITANRQNKVRYPAYPNAADRQYFLRRLLDGALAVVTTVGAVVALVFLLLL